MGYTTVEVDSGFTLLSIPFTGLNDEAGVSIQDLQIDGVTTGDVIQYWDGSSMIVDTYRTKGGVAGWWRSFTELSDKVFLPGEGFWISVTSPRVITFSGQLVAKGFTSLDSVPNQYILVGPMLPLEYNLNEIQFEGIVTGDQVQYWDGTTLQTATYRIRNGVGSWWKNFTTEAVKTVQPAEGFYLMTANPVKVTFPDVR